MTKPHPTGISLDGLQEYAKELGDYTPIDNLISDTRVLERLAASGVISFLERVLTEIEIYTRAVSNGQITIDEYNYYEEIAKNDNVLVPISYMQEIGVAWRKYLTAPTGMSLGEAFGLEGGGQGRQKSRDKLQNIVKAIRMARVVLLYRAHREEIGQPVSVKKACADMADRFADQGKGYSADAFEEALEKYQDLVREMMPAPAIGGKTS